MNLSPKSIRTRLALGYAGAVAVAVLVYAAILYTSTRSALVAQVDAQLKEDIERVEHGFEIAMDGSLSWKERGGPFHVEPGGDLPWAAIVNVGAGQELFWPASGPTLADHRGDATTYEIAGERYDISVGRPLAPVRREMSRLFRTMALCFLPIVLLAALIGLLLARRALRPIDSMTEQARGIGADRLSERLPVENPDDELGRLATVFNAAFARLEASFEQLQRFTSDAAHELRTPLAALRSVGEVGLGAAADPAAQRDVIVSMLEETDRLTRLVEDLLVLSRGDAQQAPRVREDIDLGALVRSVCEQLEVLASERDQALEIQARDVVVVGDSAALRRAITNLVDNAIRHGPARSAIGVTLRADAATAELFVSNTGPGIPEEHRARIFDRFHQVDRSRTGAGTGLGLAIAAQIATQHGGAIDLLEREGTTFRLRVPLTSP